MPWGDPAILNEIVRRTGRIRDPRIRSVIERAAVQTGLVESGGRNLPGGDADSEGWRQERASLYPNPRDVPASVDRFVREALQLYRPGIKSYELAARVQRPAAKYRGRYHDVAHEAAAILRGNGAPTGGGGQDPLGVLGALPSAGPRQMPQGSQGLLPLIEALSGAQGGSQAPSAPLPVPSFAAQPVTAGQVPMSSGGPAAKPDVASLIQAVGQLSGGDVQHAGVGGVAVPVGGAGGMAGAGGKARVAVAPGADRAGVATKPQVLSFLRDVSRISGRRVKLGTGTNHDEYTVNGNVSQHWTGDAGDVPATGRRLIQLGQAALIAAGMDPRKARRQRGGLFNVGGRQIIFNTMEGGDHTNHLHVGI